MNFEKIYQKALRESSLEQFFTDEITRKMKYLCDELVRVNSYMNLTAITDTEGIVYRHIVDCLHVCSYIETGAKVVDVGCGGGFPTLPLAIARPDLEITAVDSTAKKLEFVKGVAKDLGLRVTTISARAEDLGNDVNYRESFDVCTSRAVARLTMLSELCLPLVKVGGRFLAMKSLSTDEELKEAEKAITLLGGAVEEVKSYTLTNGTEEIERTVIIHVRINRK